MSTPTNPPAKHPPRLWRVTPGDYGEQDKQPMTWFREPTKEEMLIGYLGTPYLSLQEHTGILQEERDARMEERKALLLDRIKRDTVAAEMAGSLLGILQFYELPFNAQGAIRELLDKWKALNDADAARSPDCNNMLNQGEKEPGVKTARSPGDAGEGEKNG